MEQRTLTVKGTGQASLPPDTIQLDFDLESKAENYDETINLARTR
ncbi:SIMPL domain-containing protein, partial [Turicibacter sanguinis]|nr:SIMPL domain-containing protein [Turicibacter sanguinis]